MKWTKPEDVWRKSWEMLIVSSPSQLRRMRFDKNYFFFIFFRNTCIMPRLHRVRIFWHWLRHIIQNWWRNAKFPSNSFYNRFQINFNSCTRGSYCCELFAQYSSLWFLGRRTRTDCTKHVHKKSWFMLPKYFLSLSLSSLQKCIAIDAHW